MPRVRVKSEHRLPVFGAGETLVRPGDEFDVEDQRYLKAETESGTLWIPEAIVVTAEGVAAAGRDAAEAEAPVASPQRDTITPAGAATALSITIETYRSPQFTGEALQVDADFLKDIRQLDQWAEELELQFYITSSLRRKDVPVRGAIVPPARRSNHLVGHAIDMNLIHRGDFYNSSKLKNVHGLPPAIQELIGKIRKHPYLRWGGDFSNPDPVHVDDNLSRRDRELWEKKFLDLYRA